MLTLERPGGLRERQRQARDEAILQAAFAIMAAEGYEALTMEGLAERVGISRQTLYHHFASKEDIALRALLTLMEQGMRSMKAIDPALPPSERLERVARWMLEMRFSPAPAAFVRARPALVPVRAHPDYRRAFEQRAEALQEIVEAAQAGGEIRADTPSRLVVQMLLGLICEGQYEDLIATGTTSAEEVTQHIVDVFFAGVRSGTSACRRDAHGR